MMEKAKIFKGATNTDLIVLIDVIIEKALTKDGDKMFNATHILWLLKQKQIQMLLLM
jgi:hypothetical protein